MLSVLLKAGYYRAHTKKRVNGCATSHENQDKTEHFCCSLNPPPSNLCLVNSYRRLILVTPTQSFVSVKVRGWGGGDVPQQLTIQDGGYPMPGQPPPWCFRWWNFLGRLRRWSKDIRLAQNDLPPRIPGWRSPPTYSSPEIQHLYMTQGKSPSKLSFNHGSTPTHRAELNWFFF